MAMQYVKWQCISVFKFTFSHTYVQHLVQNENENKLYNLNLPFSTLVLICKLKTYLKLYKLQNENENVLPKLIRYV